MEHRNYKRLLDGRIDCEINHHRLGWIPFTASPDDTEEFGRDLFEELNQIGVMDTETLPLPNGYDVNNERDKRILRGKVFTVTGYGEVNLEGRQQDIANLSSLGTFALGAIGSGQGAATTKFRDKDNVVHTLTWSQVFELYTKASAYISAVYTASWNLKDSGIPADYTEDTYWP